MWVMAPISTSQWAPSTLRNSPILSTCSSQPRSPRYCMRCFDAASAPVRAIPFSASSNARYLYSRANPRARCRRSDRRGARERRSDGNRRMRATPRVDARPRARQLRRQRGLSRGRGLRCVALRLRLHGLGTAAAASAVSRFRRLFGGVGDLLKAGATLRRSPPGQHVALQPRVVPGGRLRRALGDGELAALGLKARVELIDAPFGLGAIRSSVARDFGDAVGQRLYLLLGVGERGLARLHRPRQDVRPFRQRRPPLLELADLAVKPIARPGEPLDDLISGVASDGPFHRLALQDPDVLGARGERLAHLGEQFLGGGGARTQRLEPQIHRIGFGLMSLVGLVAGGRQRDALVLGGSQADVHLLQPRPRGGQSVLAFGEATRQARRLCQRLIERRLQRALVVLQQQELFPDERAFGLQFHNPFVGAMGVIDKNLIGLAQRATIGGLLRQLALEIGDLRTHRHDFAGELGLVTFEPARGLLRQRQFPAQLLAHAFQFRRPLFERLNSARTLSWPARSSTNALRKPTLSVFSCSSACSAEPMGSTRLRKASLRSSSAPIRRSVSISRLRSASFSSPTRAPMSAKVGSLGSSILGGLGLAGVGTANAADVDAPPLRARKWVIVRMTSPQPDKSSLAYTDFCNPSQ